MSVSLYVVHGIDRSDGGSVRLPYVGASEAAAKRFAGCNGIDTETIEQIDDALSLSVLREIRMAHRAIEWIDRTYRQLSEPEMQSETALWCLREVRDNRTCGNPDGLYPRAGPHFLMNGFLERPDHPVWAIIWPPNGLRCRASISPMPWSEAIAAGFATKNRKLIRSAINKWNGKRWRLIKSGRYPDPGYGEIAPDKL